MHKWIKIYGEFYHGIIFRAKEGCHVRISNNLWKNILRLILAIINLFYIIFAFFSVIGSAKARQHVYGFVLFYLWENIETIISLHKDN